MYCYACQSTVCFCAFWTPQKVARNGGVNGIGDRRGEEGKKEETRDQNCQRLALSPQLTVGTKN